MLGALGAREETWLSVWQREKPCMYVEDLEEVLPVNLTVTKKRYFHGRLLVEMQLFMQLAGFHGKKSNIGDTLSTS